MNWVWFQFAHLNISFSLYSCHNNSCILTSITSWHWSWWKIWCLFYLNQKKITCWVWSLCPLLLQLATYRYAYFTFSALWIISSAVWLWGPWFDKQANCHGNPASLALPEVLTEHFHSPLRSDMSKPRLMCPFHFRRLFPHYGWHLQAKKHLLLKRVMLFKLKQGRGAGRSWDHPHSPHRLERRSVMFWQAHIGSREANIYEARLQRKNSSEFNTPGN